MELSIREATMGVLPFLAVLCGPD